MRLAVFVLLAGIAAVLVVPGHPDHLIVDPLAALVPASHPELRWAVWWALEDAGNIALFLPVGIIAGRLLRRWWAGALAGLVLSMVAEAAQHAIAERVPSVLDVVLNAVGALLGAVLAARIARRRVRPVSMSTPRPPHRRRVPAAS